MATGLDLLMADQPQPVDLDALLAPQPVAPLAPKPAPQPWTSRGSVTGGAIQGVNDVQNAGAQWLYNLMPPSVRNLGDSIDHWSYDKTGGVLGTQPGLDFNNAVAEQNARYETSRASNDRTGMDWSRAGGSAGAQLGAALMAGVPRLTAMGAGALGGALTPVTNMTPGSDKEFGTEAGKNVALGTVLGKGLGMFGNTVANVLSPAVSSTARLLMDAGVKLTPGQMFGGMAKSVEDKLTSVPVIGNMIQGSQGRAVESLNTAAYGRVLAPLKEAGIATQMPQGVGREAVDSITQQVQGAYNNLLPKLTTQMDPKFAQEVGHLTEMVTSGNLGEAEAQQFGKILQTKVLDKFMGQNAITGETLKTMESQLGELAGQYRGAPLGGAIAELQSQVRSLVQRSNPEYAGQLAKINEAFANLTRVQSAAAMQGASNGVFNAAQLSAAVKAGDQTVRDNAFARGQALMQDLSDPAKTVLTSSAPDSGTAGRVAQATALGAILAKPSTLLNPVVLAAGLPTAAAYSAPGQRVLNAVAQPRSAQIQQLAELLRQATDQGALPVTGGALAGR